LSITLPRLSSLAGAYYSTYPAFDISGKTALFNAALHDTRLMLREIFRARNF
jgi:hypothetical protein